MFSDYLNADLMQELGLSNLPEEQKKQLEEQMLGVVTGRLTDEFMFRLSEEDKKQFVTLVDQDGDINSFLSERIPDAEMIAAEVIANFKKDMIQMRNTAMEVRNGS